MNINLEKLLQEKVNIISPTVKELVLQVMRNACNQAIDLCAENATLYTNGGVDFGHLLNKQSILNTKDQIV